MSTGAGLFFLAIGLAAAGFFAGCGLEEFGENIRKGLGDIAEAIVADDEADRGA
ncbi:hypothetical protein ACRAVF_19060 [Bradyrhizobium oligotrophicum S58]